MEFFGVGHRNGNLAGFAAVNTPPPIPLARCANEKPHRGNGGAAAPIVNRYFIMLIFWAFM
jgi:hypothetical protein